MSHKITYIVIALLAILVMMQVIQMLQKNSTAEYYRTGCKQKDDSTWCVCSPYNECPGGWKNCGPCPPGVADNKTWDLPKVSSEVKKMGPDKCYSVQCGGVPSKIMSFTETNGKIQNGVCTNGIRFSEADIRQLLGQSCK